MIRFYKRVNSLNWKYAIGEISLIFAGITLAVCFNNWNQDNIDGRKNRTLVTLDEFLEISHLRDELINHIKFSYFIMKENSGEYEVEKRSRRINYFDGEGMNRLRIERYLQTLI